MSLFNINEKYLGIMADLESSEGELTPAILESMSLDGEDFKEKALAYREMIKRWETDLLYIKNETARLSAFKKRRENSIERLKNSIDVSLQIRGLKDLEVAPGKKFSYRASKSVEIEDESLLDEEYISTKTTSSPNKKLIGDTLKAGQPVKGAKLVEKQNLQVK